MLVCDTCGKAPAETITIRAEGRNRTKDLCATHLRELLEGSRAPRRGRRPGAVAKSPAKKSSAKKPTRKTTRKRAGRPRKAVSA